MGRRGDPRVVALRRSYLGASPTRVPKVALDQDRQVRPKRDFENFVDRFRIAEAFERENEQTLLNIETHQTRRYVQAHESRVLLLRFEKRRKVGRVVGDEHLAVEDGPTHDRPIFARAHSEPRDVRRFPMAALASDCHEFRTQALVDEEFHERA